ncbi:hypothetical protein IK146_01120 [Candidatus Saccharibacteria bacterium]|nr:hypothetical protein [Candidatus Saccharibacteria bacterium]
MNGNSIWGENETFDSVIAAGGLDNKITFYSSTNALSGGLDPSGTLSLNGVPYQLGWAGTGNYTGNDTVRLYSGYNSATISLDTIGAYKKLYILGTASGMVKGDYVDLLVFVHYTDGSADKASYQLYDLYDDTEASGIYKWPGVISRALDVAGETTEYTGTTTSAPYLQSAVIDVDTQKLISSIDFQMVGSEDNVYCGIYAITGVVSEAAPTPVERAYIDDVTETAVAIHWSSTTGATGYRLDLATDSNFKYILPEYNNLYTQETNLTISGLNSDTTYYARVRAENTEGQSTSSDIVSFTTDPETISPTITIIANPGLIQIQDNLRVLGADASGVKYIDESLDGGDTWFRAADNDYVDLTIFANGTYCFRSVDNYDNISETACVTYKNLDTAKPAFRINSNGYTEGEWTSNIITLSVEGLSTNVGQTNYYYSENEADWIAYDAPVIINIETPQSGKTYSFKAVSQAGVESDIETILVRRDVTPPTGQITSSNNGWNQFLNTITFGLFFNETKSFEIAASDAHSGVDHVEYLISDTAFESKEAALSAEGWQTTSGTVSVDPEGDFILYFKLIDSVGNVSIINTDGIVLDTTSALIYGYIDNNHVFSLENGQTYYLVQKLLVTDDHALGSITINGKETEIQDNGIINLTAGQTYFISVTDKAGNATSLAVSTGSLADLDLNLSNENFKTSDESKLLAARAELESILNLEGDHATTEEKEAIIELIDRYDILLQRIADLDSNLETISNRWLVVPSIDSVTSDDYGEIQSIIDTIQNTIDNEDSHLTIEEINTLLVQQRELEDKLYYLDAIESELVALNAVNRADVDMVKTSDKPELEELKSTAKALLAGNNLIDDERTAVDSELSKIRELLTRVNEATDAETTSAIISAGSITPTGYTIDDKDALAAAKADIETAISKYSRNYTDEEKQTLNGILTAINVALEDIDRQSWNEIRRTTFPTISIVAETHKWLAMDIAGVSATDDYGIDKLEVSSDGEQSWTLITNLESGIVEITENGTYSFRATNEFGNTDVKTITYHNIDPVTPTVFVNTHGYNSGTWTNHPIVLSAENSSLNISPVNLYYRIASTIDGENDWFPYTNSVIIATDTSSTIVEFKAVSGARVESAIERVEVKKDSVVPTGTVVISDNSFNTILNTITFGLLFNETKNYTITAADDQSGIKTIEHIVSERELVTDELINSRDWRTTDGTVSVDPDKSPVVYYRLTDYAGNISIVTLSNIVFSLPGISGVDISITHENEGYSTLAIGYGSITLVSNLEYATVDDLEAIGTDKDNLLIYLETHQGDKSGIAESIISDLDRTIDAIEEAEETFASINGTYLTIKEIDYVTSDDKEEIINLIATIIEAEKANFDHLSDAKKQVLNDVLDELYLRLSRIEETQFEYESVATSVNGYDISTVNKNDLQDLTSLESRVHSLLESANTTESEKEYLEELLTTIADLENRIAEAEKALEDAKEQDHTGGINSGNVTPEDQTCLQDAANAYAEALGVFNTNLSLADLFDINNRVNVINSALDILDQVAEFEAMISRLPDPEDVDYNSRLIIKAAESAYEALSEYGKSLVGPSLLARYRAVLDSYRAYLEGSPLLYAFETLDIFWWGVSTFAIIGIFILIVRHTHNHYVDAGDSEDF